MDIVDKIRNLVIISSFAFFSNASAQNFYNMGIVKNSFDNTLKNDISKVIEEDVNSSTALAYVLLKIGNPDNAKKNYEKLEEKLINGVGNTVPQNKNISEYKKKDIEKIFEKIKGLIKNELEVEYDINPRFLEQTFKTNKANCLAMASLYWSTCDALGLPVHLALAPKHSFIRWDPDGKHDALDSNNTVNLGDFNWECTGGGHLNDKEVINVLKINKEDVKSEKYMKSLSTRDAIKHILVQVANDCVIYGDTKRESKIYDKILIVDPNNKFALENKSTRLFNDRKYELSVPVLEKLISLYPSSDFNQYCLGIAKSEIGDITGAIYSLEKVLEINPKHEDAIFNLAGIMLRKQNHVKAIHLYDKLIEINPSDAGAYNNRGVAKLNNGDKEGAKLDFKMSKKLR